MGRNSITKKTQGEHTASIRRFSAMGVKYHTLQPCDTMSSICFKYNVTASAIRRANMGLSGSNVQTGPKKLIIPPQAEQQNEPLLAYEKKETDKTEVSTDEASDDDDADEEEEGLQYHDVGPSDTLNLICLKYGVKAYELRKVNNFRGTNLTDAPERLVIPNHAKKQSQDKPRLMTNNEKVNAVLAHAPSDKRTKNPAISYGCAMAYLEKNDWDVLQAVRNMNVDLSDKDFNPRKVTVKSVKRRSLLRRRSKAQFVFLY